MPTVHAVHDCKSVIGIGRTSPKSGASLVLGFCDNPTAIVTRLSTSQSFHGEEGQRALERERGLRHARSVAIRTSFVLVIAYIVCWTPHCVLQVVY